MEKTPKISTGQPSTLKTYREIAYIMGGLTDNPAVKLIDEKISEQGEDAIVIQDESQMLMLFAELLKSGG